MISYLVGLDFLLEKVANKVGLGVPTWVGYVHYLGWFSTKSGLVFHKIWAGFSQNLGWFSTKSGLVFLKIWAGFPQNLGWFFSKSRLAFSQNLGWSFLKHHLGFPRYLGWIFPLSGLDIPIIWAGYFRSLSPLQGAPCHPYRVTENDLKCYIIGIPCHPYRVLPVTPTGCSLSPLQGLYIGMSKGWT